MSDNDNLLAEPAGKAPLPGTSGNMDMTSPVDLPPMEDEGGNSLLWASIAIAVAAAFLLVFNASALRGWAFELEPGPQSEQVVQLAGGWYDFTERLYLDRPVAAMSGWWEGIKAIEFGSDDDPGEAADAASMPADDEPEETEGPGFSVE